MTINKICVECIFGGYQKMSRTRAAPPPLGAARGGDDCHDPSMPELVDIRMIADELRENEEFRPKFKLLTEL